MNSQEEADTEWKFARSKIYMEFIKNSNELPVPFNIFPTPKSMCRLFASCCCKKEETEATQASDDDIEDARVGNQRYCLFCFSFELRAIVYILNTM